LRVLLKYLFLSFLGVGAVVFVVSEIGMFYETVASISCASSVRKIQEAVDKAIVDGMRIPKFYPIPLEELEREGYLKYHLSCKIGTFFFIDAENRVRCSYHGADKWLVR